MFLVPGVSVGSQGNVRVYKSSKKVETPARFPCPDGAGAAGCRRGCAPGRQGWPQHPPHVCWCKVFLSLLWRPEEAPVPEQVLLPSHVAQTGHRPSLRLPQSLMEQIPTRSFSWGVLWGLLL